MGSITRKRGFIAIVLAAGLLGSMPAHAASESQDYALGRRVVTPAFSAGGSSLTFNVDFRIRSVRIQDMVAGDVGVLLCQDSGDDVCGQDTLGTGPDVTWSGCLRSGQQTNVTGNFAPNTDTSVFIDLVDLNEAAEGGDCNEVSSAGTVTVFS